MNNIDNILDDVAKLLRDNLGLMLLNDKYLVNLKNECCKEHITLPLSNRELLFFAEEALSDLINVDYLYDFRDIE